MDSVKTLVVQHPRTPWRMGSGTITQPSTEQERSVSAPAGTAAGGQPAVTGKGELYKRRGAAKRGSAERKSAVAILVATMARTT